VDAEMHRRCVIGSLAAYLRRAWEPALGRSATEDESWYRAERFVDAAANRESVLLFSARLFRGSPESDTSAAALAAAFAKQGGHMSHGVALNILYDLSERERDYPARRVSGTAVSEGSS
jgi:hypothetical protein